MNIWNILRINKISICYQNCFISLIFHYILFLYFKIHVKCLFVRILQLNCKEILYKQLFAFLLQVYGLKRETMHNKRVTVDVESYSSEDIPHHHHHQNHHQHHESPPLTPSLSPSPPPPPMRWTTLMQARKNRQVRNAKLHF